MARDWDNIAEFDCVDFEMSGYWNNQGFQSEELSFSLGFAEDEVFYISGLIMRTKRSFIYNAPLEYADLILNGDPETYLKTVTEYKNLD